MRALLLARGHPQLGETGHVQARIAVSDSVELADARSPDPGRRHGDRADLGAGLARAGLAGRHLAGCARQERRRQWRRPRRWQRRRSRRWQWRRQGCVGAWPRRPWHGPGSRPRPGSGPGQGVPGPRPAGRRCAQRQGVRARAAGRADRPGQAALRPWPWPGRAGRPRRRRGALARWRIVSRRPRPRFDRAWLARPGGARRVQEPRRAGADDGRARQAARLRRQGRRPAGQLRHPLRERHRADRGGAGAAGSRSVPPRRAGGRARRRGRRGQARQRRQSRLGARRSRRERRWRGRPARSGGARRRPATRVRRTVPSAPAAS